MVKNKYFYLFKTVFRYIIFNKFCFLIYNIINNFNKYFFIIDQT